MSKDSAYKFSLQFEVKFLLVLSRSVTGVKGQDSADPFVWLQELKSVGLDLPHEAAELPVNRAKNRYTNILPCKSQASGQGLQADL